MSEYQAGDEVRVPSGMGGVWQGVIKEGPNVMGMYLVDITHPGWERWILTNRNHEGWYTPEEILPGHHAKE